MPRWSRLAYLGLALLVPASCKVTTDTTAPQGPAGPGRQATVDGAIAPGNDVLAKSDLPSELSTPLAEDPMGVTIHRLSNGMTVYISTDRQKPRFTAWVGVRAGSRMDPANSTGLAHYLEHMLFKGTDEYGTLDANAEAPHVEAVRKLYAELRATTDADHRASIIGKIDAETQAMAKYAVPNEFDRMYSSLGVEGLNAFTSDEQTVYIGDLPSNRLAQWAAVEAERFSDPVFRLFYPELEAVYEEKNLSLDRPYTQVWNAMLGALYPQHPYGTQTTIGSVDHLKNPAYQDMSDYFERWYVPNNMAIVLAGDIDAPTALPVLEEAFAVLQPRAVPKPEPGTIPPLQGRVSRVVRTEGEPAVNLAWLTVPTGHEDEAALTVLDRVLDDASVGLLNVELELSQKVPSAGSGHSTMIESGYFMTYARARNSQELEDVEDMLMEVVQKVKGGAFTEADVDSAKLQWTNDQKLQREFPFVRASRMMSAFIEHRPWNSVIAADTAIEKVTRADVIRVANKYLGSDYVSVFKRKGKPEIPKLEKPSITPVPIDPERKSPFAARIESMPAPQLEPEWAKEGTHYQHHAVPSGEVITVKNERNDLFSVTYRMKRGYRKEPLLCYALELFELSGTSKKSPEALQKELYALGSSISTGCDADYSWVSLDGVDSNLESTLALLDEWLADPSFRSEVLARHLDNTLSERKDQLEQDRYLTQALDAYAKYGKNSAWLQQPSNAALTRARAGQLSKLMSSVLDYRNDTLYYGPREGAAASKTLARTVDSQGNGTFTDPGPTWTRTFRKNSAPTLYFLHKDGAKANVRFVLPQRALRREERPVAKLYSQYLSGNMSALVFQEIRESRGLAYSAYSSYNWGDTPQDASGLFGYLSTQADKTPTAVETFLGLLQKPEIQAPRLAEAKSALDQEYRATRIDPRWLTWSVLGWDELEERDDPRAWEWKQVEATDAQAVEAFAKGFASTPVIVAVVGDRDRVGLDALRKVGQIREVQPAALFGYGRFAPPKRSKTKKRVKKSKTTDETIGAKK